MGSVWTATDPPRSRSRRNPSFLFSTTPGLMSHRGRDPPRTLQFDPRVQSRDPDLHDMGQGLPRPCSYVTDWGNHYTGSPSLGPVARKRFLSRAESGPTTSPSRFLLDPFGFRDPGSISSRLSAIPVSRTLRSGGSPGPGALCLDLRRRFVAPGRGLVPLPPTQGVRSVLDGLPLPPPCSARRDPGESPRPGIWS